MDSLKDKVSYAIGLSIGKNMKQDNVELDPDLLLRGLKDALSGAKPLLTEAQIQEAMVAFQKEMQAKAAEARKASGEKSKKEGEEFLAANKKAAGVVTLPSGLQYKIIKKGNGKVSPKATDTVVTHYRGTLLDGTEFDSSIKRGEPAEFEVGGVIPGWTEALQLMKVGDKWELYVPAELAYGERGAGRAIGPNATLVFEVELLEIKPAEKEK
ncbi:MAG TPA: FKBP-type peptidyl-prolyl cis-trans isomerase [Planctomycetota bacterium]|nr:FKBP-type peptidyl-prolyl cis-trans isomerase [Planctomycetota bacterium]HRR82281.1 FKBP-type peptidyl-prolyl cis-trans isomerase [Planctomycetota bacterium]HRT93190.1 FKBP-type peptidyl-prolyl cis-trans isomerase [Planctomycetota bacterium]